MIPAVGKSGPFTRVMSASTEMSGSSMSAIVASTTSRRLCGGMFVAMPTAMPDEPLTSRVGEAGGRDERFVVAPVVVGHEVDGVHVEVAQHLHGQARQARLRVAHGRR